MADCSWGKCGLTFSFRVRNRWRHMNRRHRTTTCVFFFCYKCLTTVLFSLKSILLISDDDDILCRSQNTLQVATALKLYSSCSGRERQRVENVGGARAAPPKSGGAGLVGWRGRNLGHMASRWQMVCWRGAELAGWRDRSNATYCWPGRILSYVVRGADVIPT